MASTKNPECGPAQPYCYLFEIGLLFGIESFIPCHILSSIIAVNKLFLNSEIYKHNIQVKSVTTVLFSFLHIEFIQKKETRISEIKRKQAGAELCQAQIKLGLAKI